jgi:hypothetical protein
MSGHVAELVVEFAVGHVILLGKLSSADGFGLSGGNRLRGE